MTATHDTTENIIDCIGFIDGEETKGTVASYTITGQVQKAHILRCQDGMMLIFQDTDGRTTCADVDWLDGFEVLDLLLQTRERTYELFKAAFNKARSA